jgi:hypothetical protein
MRFFLLLLILLSINILMPAQEEEKENFSLFIYGSMFYQHFDYGPNQKATPGGSKKDNRAIIDVNKLVLEPEYHFTDDLYLEAGIEFEHLGTGSALELEYEEFGEYEFESEKGGEVQLEEIYIAKLFAEEFNLRIGRFPVPLTLHNRMHLPVNYFGTVAPESESMIIPSIWYETGIEAWGSLWGFSYSAALINGLDATGFSSEKWIAEGYQTKFEQVNATDPAVVFRLDYTGTENLLAGGSVYYGNTSGNRPKPEDMEGIDAHVTILDAHLFYSAGPVLFRGNLIYGNLENSAIVSQRNARLSVNIQTPRTPVAKNAIAYYAEAGYNIFPLISSSPAYKLYPFFRYEYYNTMQKVQPGVFASPRFERSIYTGGINLSWNDKIILKLDYSSRIVGKGNFNTENTIGFGLGFNTEVIKL